MDDADLKYNPLDIPALLVPFAKEGVRLSLLHYLPSYSAGKPYLRVKEIDARDPKNFQDMEEQFDTVLMLNVLEHLRDKQRVRYETFGLSLDQVVARSFLCRSTHRYMVLWMKRLSIVSVTHQQRLSEGSPMPGFASRRCLTLIVSRSWDGG